MDTRFHTCVTNFHSINMSGFRLRFRISSQYWRYFSRKKMRWLTLKRNQFIHSSISKVFPARWNKNDFETLSGLKIGIFHKTMVFWSVFLAVCPWRRSSYYEVRIHVWKICSFFFVGVLADCRQNHRLSLIEKMHVSRSSQWQWLWSHAWTN